MLQLTRLTMFATITIFGVGMPPIAAYGDTLLCQEYERLYTEANKNLASIYVRGWGDDSAPRESSRQLEMLNERIFQLLLVEQMQSHGCSIPKKPSTFSEFLSSAFACQFSSKEDRKAKCDSDGWSSTYDGAEIYK